MLRSNFSLPKVIHESIVPRFKSGFRIWFSVITQKRVKISNRKIQKSKSNVTYVISFFAFLNHIDGVSDGVVHIPKTNFLDSSKVWIQPTLGWNAVTNVLFKNLPQPGFISHIFMVSASWSTIFRPCEGSTSGGPAFTLLKVSILMSHLVRLVMVRNVKMCFLLYRDHTKILDVIKTLVGYVVNSGQKWLSKIWYHLLFRTLYIFNIRLELPW